MRYLFLIGSILVGTLAHGQSRVGFFGGGQHDHIRYRLSEVDAYFYNRHESKSTSIGMGTGWGWHVGGSFLSGRGKTAYKGSIVYSEQHVYSSYRSSQRYGGLAGSSSTVTDGRTTERFQIIEAPLLLSIAMNKALRFEVGLSLSTLVAVKKCDRSIVSTSWWIHTASGASQYLSETCTSDAKPYSRLGLSGVVGFTGMIKDRISISGNCLVGFVPVYEGQDPYKGHHNVFRLSIGYFIDLRKSKIGS